MGKIITDNKKIKEILERGVEDIITKEELEKKLKSGKELRVKIGFDPTGKKIHIGRAIVLRKLKAFQDLGHKVVFIAGDFTARIGDPSDKLEKRPILTKEQIKENLKDYKSQVGKIVDLKKAEFHFNSRWLKKLGFEEISELAESFTVQQMLARRNFKERFEAGKEISVREFLYPLLQGYDSVTVKADVEIGGFDQLFNLKAGREIQKDYGQKEQSALTTEMLEGTDGRKMSTSWGNVINITDETDDMFGKVMAVRDDLIKKYFILTTGEEMKEIERMEKEMEKGKTNPRDIKLKLAFELVKLYHGEKKAKEARENWINIFSKREGPEEMEEVIIKKEKILLIDWLYNNKITKSKNEGRRLAEQGAVKINGEKVSGIDKGIEFKGGEVIKIGKKRFVRIKIK